MNNPIEAIIHAAQSALSAKGRIIARAKAEGALDKQGITGKKDTSRTTGYISVTERIKASGCSEADKRALDVAKAAETLMGAAGLTAFPRKDEIPTGGAVDALNAKLEMLRASNETLEAQVAELRAALEAATAKSPKGKAKANA